MKIGVSLGTVQNLLLGDTEIKNSTLEKFYRYFKVPFEAQTPSPSPTTSSAYDMLLKALMDRIDVQGKVIQTTQETVAILQKQLTDITASLGQEIGEIKNKMYDTARSGDLHRLDPDPTRPYRN